MYKLSNLPIEILYMICNHLETEDLVTVARLNHWYGYRLATLLDERIHRYVEHEGWRIHIDILAKSYPIKPITQTKLPYTTELLLLGEYARLNPYTLTLEFDLCPIDEEGLDPVKNASQNERSIVLFDQIKTNIDIVAYFAQISSNRRLQHVNHAGASIMNDKNLWQQFSKSKPHSGMSVMGSNFKVNYNMCTPQERQDTLLSSFKQNYNKYFKDLCHIQEESPAILSFDKIHVSPEWWVKQMNTATINNFGPEIEQQGLLVE